MSKYTTEVRFICEQATGLSESKGYSNINDIIQKAIPKVFNFDFPMFDENYRNVLCTKILKHYYTREICEETVGLWKLRLETRMNEIMPFFNKLYKSELIEFNPMFDTELTTENTGTKTEQAEKSEKDVTDRTEKNRHNDEITDDSSTTTKGSTNVVDIGTTTNNKKSKDMYSDTPQGSLENVENETYLTNARKINDENTEIRNNNNDVTTNENATYGNTRKEVRSHTFEEDTTLTRSGNTNINSTDKYVQTYIGKSGGQSYSKLLEEFRRTFINIDMRVIGELSDLFFGLW